jgi:hypothetical protein
LICTLQGLIVVRVFNGEEESDMMIAKIEAIRGINEQFVTRNTNFESSFLCLRIVYYEIYVRKLFALSGTDQECTNEKLYTQTCPHTLGKRIVRRIVHRLDSNFLESFVASTTVWVSLEEQGRSGGRRAKLKYIFQ